ncbi:BREX-1 system adenine-specific DNA-methyltransferase PglX [Shimia thalassica]|uniref:BREX-1 system adenine-specific DNA-methyltransferase PglX n=1 Tax=Shimia thalassica TaxID=1715693 RepID=UPI0026E2DEB0|nr:BREX-1 system adenine-specific DNA-methyltransferase PglX [Shimia thalassica]MDO6479832.1 BREX-1 system adenine-specific DNA-methyltransferase PglX [Shimia thalassica]
MDTNALKKFAQAARNLLIDQVSSRLDRVIAESSMERREHPQAIKDLENAIRKNGQQQVIEQVAYTWFNRFTALRFMDANDYTQVRVVSPSEGATRPELLAEAAAGNLPDGAPDRILALLDGRIPSNDGQSEAYRMLLVHECNRLHDALPYMFEAIDDYSELLMPDDLLSSSSILTETRAVMTADACQDVEIIGWLYQFYISEKKDQVFAGLKKNQKITAENIPAATQLFTPHWIVRYLVENSLGRLWLLNNPQSGLAAKMDYYIAPEEPESDFLKITKPEEIRICDPAAGSGHMLTYAFDLLYAIYEEEGYDPTEIPALILTHNLTGVEIDDRAGALAAFALAMKAAAKLGRRRFLRMEAKPDICVLQNVSFTEAEMQDVAAVVGKDLFTDELRETLGQFEQAKNFGSLIVPKLRDPAETLRVVEARDFGGDLLLKEVQERVVTVLRMAEALSPKYHVVVANPPYMGGKGMNGKLGDFAKTYYPDSKSDLFAMFMERGLSLGYSRGYLAVVNLPSWLFLSSFEKLRIRLVEENFIQSLLHMGRGIFGIDWGSAAFVIAKNPSPAKQGNYFRLHKRNFQHIKCEDIGELFKRAKNDPLFRFDFDSYRDEHGTSAIPTESSADGLQLSYSAKGEDFGLVPGTTIAYWLSDPMKAAFAHGEPLDNFAPCRQGVATADNNRFLREWAEVSRDRIGMRMESRNEAKTSQRKWFPYNKGGDFRRWFGNNETVVNWENDGAELFGNRPKSVIRNPEFFFRKGLTWSFVSSVAFGIRYSDCGAVFDVGGSTCFPNEDEIFPVLGFLASKVAVGMLNAMNPTLNYQVGNIASLPLDQSKLSGLSLNETISEIIALSRSDWDAYETSWDFTTLPLLAPDHRGETLEDSYATLRAHWQGMTDEMQRLEEENNRIFIDAYGLQDELTPEVPLNEITLTCNPAYRYGIKNDTAANETRLRADTMAEFLSYAVGCMFGRYSLDAPGLILANQGETLADYLARVPSPSFEPDEDNVIPVLNDDWFTDDIVARFRKFLRVTFGEENFQDNLRFVEDSLGKDLRKYFTKDFYTDHVKRYKKRPIYWMFSSPKGTFNALIYMHRYRSDTVSVVLNDYLREFISKLEAERARLEKLADDATATQGQRTKALREAGKVAKQIDELTDWERDVVFPLAQQKTEIDLDDGVKANYPKFGSALKKITGLS